MNEMLNMGKPCMNKTPISQIQKHSLHEPILTFAMIERLRTVFVFHQITNIMYMPFSCDTFVIRLLL